MKKTELEEALCILFDKKAFEHHDKKVWVEQRAKSIRAQATMIKETTRKSPKAGWLKQLWADDAIDASPGEEAVGSLQPEPVAQTSSSNSAPNFFFGFEGEIKQAWRMPVDGRPQTKEYTDQLSIKEGSFDFDPVQASWTWKYLTENLD